MRPTTRRVLSLSLWLCVAGPAIASPYSQAVLDDGPIGYWRLGETIGAGNALDSSNSGHDGAYIGGVTLAIPGAIRLDSDSAAGFDGTTGHVLVGGQPTYSSLANGFTLEAWIKPNSFGGFREIISVFDFSPGPTGFGFGIIDNRLRFGTKGQQTYIANITAITRSNWHHIVVAFDNNNAATFYLDGVLTQTVAGSDPAALGNGALTIGSQSPPNAALFFHGGIDEVAVYPRVLATAEIQEHYFASRPSNVQIVKLINTGFDDVSLAKIADGNQDADFVIAAGSSGGHVGETPIARSMPFAPTWVPDAASGDSRWLVLTGGPPNGHAVDPGTYIFETTVDLTGYLAETAEIQRLRTSADNALVSVRINGQLIYSKPDSFVEEFVAFTELGNVGLGFFEGGVNSIRFEIVNTGLVENDMGFRAEGTVVAAPVPEPSTAGLATFGAVVGLLALTVRRFSNSLKRRQTTRPEHPLICPVLFGALSTR